MPQARTILNLRQSKLKPDMLLNRMLRMMRYYAAGMLLLGWRGGAELWTSMGGGG